MVAAAKGRRAGSASTPCEWHVPHSTSLYWISRGFPATYPLVKGPALNKSRAQVMQELQAANERPVTIDGMRDMGGEAGWVDARQLP